MVQYVIVMHLNPKALGYVLIPFIVPQRVPIHRNCGGFKVPSILCFGSPAM